MQFSKIRILQPEIIFTVVLFTIEIWFSSIFKFNCNIDSLSYLSKALEYKQGLFAEAINGYWSPLFTWLLVPFTFLISDGLLAIKILTALSSVTALYFSIRLFKWISQDNISAWFIAFPFGILVFSYYSFASGPDMLVAALFIFYLEFKFKIVRDRYSDLLMAEGLLLAILFLAKQYYWFLCVALLILYSVITGLFFGNERMKKEFFRSVKVILISFLILIPWTVTLSWKYKQLTFAQSASLNTQWYFEGKDSSIPKVFSAPKPYPSSITFWDEPAFIPMNDAKDFSFDGMAEKVKMNFKVFFNWSDGVLKKSLWLLTLFSLFVIFFLRKQNRHSDKFLFLLLGIGVYVIGYSLVTVDVRYLFHVWLISIISGGAALVLILKQFKISKWVSVTGFIFLCFWCTAGSVYIPVQNFHRAKMIEKELKIAEKIIQPHSSVLLLNNEDVPVSWTYFLKLNYKGTVFTNRVVESNDVILSNGRVNFIITHDNPNRYFKSIRFDSISTFNYYGKLFKIQYD